MAQSGFTPVQLYRSATPGAVPTAANLAPGELALNTADQKLFFENASGVVVSIDTANGTVTSVNASGGTTGLTFSGGPITTSGTLTLAGTLAVANGGTGVTSSTGTVAVVLSNSPTLVTPNLGTPSAVTLTNATGLPLTTGVTGTLAVANGGTGVTTSTGTVAVVLSNSPVLVTPTLGAASATSIANGLGAVGTPSYTFTGDLNTGMWSPGTDTVAFSTNGAERARIDASGNVGIGTSSPATMLDVNGSVTANQNFFAATGGVWFNAANTFTRGMAQAGSDVNFFTSGTERMRIDSSGNVGIGTTGPGYRLDVASGDTTASIGYAMRIRSNATATAASLQFTNSGASAQNGVIICTDAGTMTLQSDGASSLLAFRTNGNERMRIGSDGHVGMGTSTRLGTNETLSVSAISTFDGMWVKNLAAAAATMVVWNAATSGDNSFIGFGTEAAVTNRGSITYNRAGGLVAYNVTSDYRAKDIIGPVTDAGATIDALKVYSGKMKGATLVRPMLVAHEAQEVVPYAVTGEKDAVNEDGTDKYQHMDHQSLVPLLIAEVQSLRARVAQLEATTSTIKFEGE